MNNQATPTQARQEIERLYKLIIIDANELDKLFTEILNAPKYKSLWPNVNQWIEWVCIARKMADFARTTGEGIPEKETVEIYLEVPINIKNINGLDPATYDKINNLVSQIYSMISEIMILFARIGLQEAFDEEKDENT